MNIEQFQAYCLSKKGTTQDFPFDENVLCFKVMGKIFALTDLNNEKFEVNLKCAPEYAIELREQYEDIRPGWHMNKKHWNTVYFEGTLNEALLQKLVDHSYESVLKTLKKSVRETLEKA